MFAYKTLKTKVFMMYAVIQIVPKLQKTFTFVCLFVLNEHK